jgi:hypothetical protein
MPGGAEVRPTRRSASTASGGQQRSAPATASKNANLLLRGSLVTRRSASDLLQLRKTKIKQLHSMLAEIDMRPQIAAALDLDDDAFAELRM